MSNCAVHASKSLCNVPIRLAGRTVENVSTVDIGCALDWCALASAATWKALSLLPKKSNGDVDTSQVINISSGFNGAKDGRNGHTHTRLLNDVDNRSAARPTKYVQSFPSKRILTINVEPTPFIVFAPFCRTLCAWIDTRRQHEIAT